MPETETQALAEKAVERLLVEFNRTDADESTRNLLNIAWCDGRLDGLARWEESLTALRVKP
jgi:hypothetical protein